MGLEVDVHPLPQPGTGGTVVVIDVLRMTTTAAVLVAAGVEAIRVVADLEEARRLAAADGAMLLGERGERALPGFDGGNSPLEYLGRDLRGRRVVLTTSNGAKAVEAGAAADRLLLGAVVNAPAVARAVLAGAPERVSLSCAGTGGRISLDDLLGAACIAHELQRLAPAACLSDMARSAMALLRAYPDTHAALADAAHGRRLQRSGFGDDVAFASRLGALETWVERMPGERTAMRGMTVAAGSAAAGADAAAAP